MSLDARTAQEQLTPDARRMMLRAFGDRMLLKLGNMDDPEDLAGIERAVRVAAVIERIYSRCDRAQGHAPDPNMLEAERARHMKDAIQARFELATSLEWNEKNQQRMGTWLDAAATAVKAPVPAPVAAPAPSKAVAQSPALAATEVIPEAPAASPETDSVSTPAARSPRPAQTDPLAAYLDLADDIRAARRALGLKDLSRTERAETQPDAGGRDPP